MSAIAIINKAVKPLPLSCLCHGLILLIVGLWGSSYQPAYTQESEAAVEFEMTEQELAQVKEIQQVEPEPTESIDDIAGRFAARVEANKRYPSMAIRMDQQGVVMVYATLSADGNLLDYGVSSSSGYDNLDKAALKAVASSCPFSHGANGSITITVPIHFQLD